MDETRDEQAWPDEALLARCLAEADDEGFIDFKVFCRALDVSASALAGFFHERDRFYDSPEMVALRDGLNHRVEWRERKRRDGTSHEPARFVVKRAQIHQDDLVCFCGDQSDISPRRGRHLIGRYCTGGSNSLASPIFIESWPGVANDDGGPSMGPPFYIRMTGAGFLRVLRGLPCCQDKQLALSWRCGTLYSPAPSCPGTAF
ncbi:hypothetical protein [Aeromonas sanarellii]|uniref:hypothetical protein n=1 Tax=Aeromonas sanarellii TaxID=633415 RepID=UPI0038D0687C